MKKTLTLSLLSLLAVSAIAPTTVKAEDYETPATVSVAQGSGGLEFTSASDTIDFGTIKIDKTQQYTTATATNDFFANILDARGTNEGWNLSVYYGNRMDNAWEGSGTADGKHLPGSILTFDTSQSQFTHDDSADFDVTKQPSVPDSVVVLGADYDNTVVMNADTDSGRGLGQWTQTIPKSAITLQIPSATTIAGSYTADISWTLQDTPDYE